MKDVCFPERKENKERRVNSKSSVIISKFKNFILIFTDYLKNKKENSMSIKCMIRQFCNEFVNENLNVKSS